MFIILIVFDNLKAIFYSNNRTSVDTEFICAKDDFDIKLSMDYRRMTSKFMDRALFPDYIVLKM